MVSKKEQDRAKLIRKIVVLCVVGLILIAGTIFLVIHFNSNKSPSSVNQPPVEGNHPTAIKKAIALSESRQYSAAASQLQSYVGSNGPTAPEKVDAYIQLAAVYMNDKQYQKAIDNYKLAAQLSANPNPAVVEGLGYAYMGLGDKANAIDYFKQSINLTAKDDPMSQTDIKGYQYLIKQLGGTP